MATAAGIAFYHFGPFRLDPIRSRLLKDGVRVPLTPTAFRLLLLLVQRAGQDIEKDELINLVWPETIVEENNLPHTISKLRKALNERLDDHKYIVTAPGRGYRFVAPVRAVGADDGAVGAANAISGRRLTRLIVLPFRLLRPDPEIEFLTFSLPDAITMSLSRLESLTVRSSATAARLAGHTTDPQVVATKADVDVVLTGSLLRVEEQLRLNAQLVEAPSGTVLWSRTCQVTLGNVLRVQDELVARIVGSLALPLTAQDHRWLKHDAATVDVEVYTAYLKGRYHLNKRTPEGFARALAAFTAAIERDSNYGPAYAGLADSYMLGGASSLSHREAMTRAKTAAMTALSIDDDLAEAHASLAAVAFRWDWDWDTTEGHFTRAIELNPGVASVRHGYALFLAAMRRFPEALTEMHRAYAIDPLSLVVNAGLGRVLDFARRHDEAVDQYHKTLDIDAGFADAHFDLALALTHKGRYEEALAAAGKAVALAPDSLVYAECVAYTRAIMGDREHAEEFLGILDDRSMNSYVSPALRAHVLLGLGRVDEVFASLHAACDERATEMVYLNADPDSDGLRSDERFADLLRRIGFPN